MRFFHWLNVFADDSSSMKTGNRIFALQETIKKVAEIATVLEPSGMSIRFINSRRDGRFDHLTDMDDIMEKVQTVEYNGDTKLGTNLQLDRKSTRLNSSHTVISYA